MVKWQFYTNSLNKKANLRKDLESILGRGLKKAELQDGYNVPELVGQSWQVNIIHDHSGDSVKDKISSMTKLFGDGPKPLPELSVIEYSKGLGVIEQWELLPPWVQEKVSQQIEGDAPTPPPAGSEPFEDDTLPF
jgi:hypothetical protein